ncbi:MAG TPA: glycosyltransferase family 4 protein [Bacteroidota bacterium]|nr:glycosyltransferase family 4 protein [Bacteroidota bacterium]
MTTIMIAHALPFAVSGAELAIADMVEQIGGGIRCIMLTPGEGPLAAFYRKRGFEVLARSIQTRRRLYPGLHTLQSAYYARAFQRLGVDGVVCNTFSAAGRVGTLCRMARIPHAVYVREYIRNIPLHRRMLRRATSVFAVSADVAAYLGAFMDGRTLFVARDYIDTRPIERRIEAHRRSGTRLLPFGPGTPVVGFVGRITPYKQPDLFLRMIPHVLREIPACRFVVVGGHHTTAVEYAGSLRALARELGVERSVSFMGARDDAIEIMAELSAFCLTSDREPFPRTILEAQLAGCPVAAANSGGCPELVEDGVTGLLFDPLGDGAPAALASRVALILRDAELSRTLAEAARAHVAGAEGSRAPVNEFVRLLGALTASRAGAPGRN